ncbi:MAG: general secretion pathway protein GspB [Proteobacteria bacterium]|nr:general secretion pathway protein GspB [Pseudomonadota bacterium]MBU1738979.1 general secretion pathway protein GspB [Pseudomonadota bacterium]
MSFILDALKKSDQERKKGEIPNLNTVQDLSGTKKRPARPPWVLILIAAFALNGLLFGIWLSSDRSGNTLPPVPATAVSDNRIASSDPVDTPAAEPALPADTPVAAAPEVTAAPAVTATETETASPVQEENTADAAGETLPAEVPDTEYLVPADEVTDPFEETEQVDSGPARPITYEKLPTELRNELPKLKISLHYYSDSPSSRKASINGRMMREGQEVGKGLILHEITREGVIFSYRKILFSYQVFNR